MQLFLRMVMLGAAAARKSSVSGSTFCAEASTSDLLKQASVDNVKLAWRKDVQVRGQRTTLGAAYDHHKKPSFLSELQLSGNVREVLYDLKHNLVDKVTFLQLSTATRGGSIFMASVASTGVQDVSVFHTAGPINVQPAWLVASQIARLTFGSGSTRKRCPISLQVEYPLQNGKPSWEMGFRKTGPGRNLRAKVLPTEKKGWIEYADYHVEPGATWTAKLSGPLSLRPGAWIHPAGTQTAPELVLKRIWRW